MTRISLLVIGAIIAAAAILSGLGIETQHTPSCVAGDTPSIFTNCKVR